MITYIIDSRYDPNPPFGNSVHPAQSGRPEQAHWQARAPMLDESTEFPAYTQSLGLASVDVYEYDGVYSMFLIRDRVNCFFGNRNSLEGCQEEIES